jgi:hypothetical protein
MPRKVRANPMEHALLMGRPEARGEMRIRVRAMSLGAALLATAGVAAGERAQSHGDDASRGSGTVVAATRRGGDARVPVERTIAAPAAVTPAPGEVLASQPTLSWRLEGLLDGARVELSPTADFADETTLRYDATGDRLVVPAVPGTWFWRLRGRSAGDTGERTGPTSSFTVVRARPSRPDDPDWGNPYDVLLHGHRLGPTRDMR